MQNFSKCRQHEAETGWKNGTHYLGVGFTKGESRDASAENTLFEVQPTPLKLFKSVFVTLALFQKSSPFFTLIDRTCSGGSEENYGFPGV